MIFSDLSWDLALILASSLSAFLIVLFLSKPYTNLLKKFQFGQQIKETAMGGTKTPLFNTLHKKKTGTPTMGGVLIWLTVAIVCLLSPIFVKLGITKYHLISREETYLPLFTLLSFASIGFIDDFLNVKNIGKYKGLRALTKFIWLTILGILGAYWFYSKLGYDSITLLSHTYHVGWLYVPIFVFIIVGSSNAVNITDGLDGLAAGLIIIAFGALAIIAFFKGLLILTAFCALIIGATSAFLWNNIPPAQFFMGDTGSLSLGATMAVIAFMTDTVLLLPFIAFIFVLETLSVIAQVTSKKLLKRKLFHIAPLHHHFEYLGWPEFRVTMRFWMIGSFFAVLGVILISGRFI